MKSSYVKGRDITLDIHVIDGNRTEFDVEVQRNVEGSHNRRIRFHGSMMDVRMLKKKQKFKELKDAYDIYYKPLADGVRHFKETEEGRDAMCESFNKLADKVAEERAEEREVQTTARNVASLMDSMKMTLEQALNALKIQGKDRAIIAKQLQK